MRMPTVESFINFLKNKGLSQRTIKNYTYYFFKFGRTLFSQETVNQFLSSSTTRNLVSRGFLFNYKKFLVQNYKELQISFMEKADILEVELPTLTGRKTSKLVNPIMHDDITLLEKALPDELNKLRLLISYYCALRIGELMTIKLSSFNWEKWKKDDSKMMECKVYGKGSKEGLALIPSILMKRIRLYIASQKFPTTDPYIFWKVRAKSLECQIRDWQIALHKAGVDSGLTRLNEYKNPIEGTKVHPHRLRHSYASYLLNEKNMDIRDIQEVLRHTSILSTQIYVHVDKEKLKEKLKDNYSTKNVKTKVEESLSFLD